jgi:DNA-binding HxlR family transcriptional regulator
VSSPQPGRQVRGSTSGSPINALFDLLGRRWALGVLWQLGDGPLVFRRLQERCGGVSPSVLNARLKELREAGIVNRCDDGYVLSDRGAALRKLIVPVAVWSAEWAQDVYSYEREGMRERLAAEGSQIASP